MNEILYFGFRLSWQIFIRCKIHALLKKVFACISTDYHTFNGTWTLLHYLGQTDVRKSVSLGVTYIKNNKLLIRKKKQMFSFRLFRLL